MAFTLTINTDNAAFEDEGEYEVANILRKAAEIVEDGEDSFVLRDVNGNKVGTASFDNE